MNYAGKFDATSEGPGTHSHAYVNIDSSQTHAPSDALIVPDAQLLFHADYSRSGTDLVLTGEDRHYVVHDYFKGTHRAPLASRDGAHLTPDVIKALVGEVHLAQAGNNPAASQVIGHVTKLQGSATVIRNGVSIILNNGDNVEKGDVVQSGSSSTVGITFIDGTVFGLSSNARMVMNEMVYDPNGSSNSSLMSLVAGTITFVAGETAKHGDMKIDTPVATMGIRGTAVLVEIDFTVPGQNGAPNASFQVLVEPDGTTGSYILFDKTTLQPIAIVNQAGQQININNGIISQTTNPLSPEQQKLIGDVFQQKFTDNTNTKTTAPGTDSITPTSNTITKTADGQSVTEKTVTANLTGGPSGSSAPPPPPNAGVFHIAGPPTVDSTTLLGDHTTRFSTAELTGQTASPLPDGAAGFINFKDINQGDRPTVTVEFNSVTYNNAAGSFTLAKGQTSLPGLSGLQIADIVATQVNLTLIPGAGNTNNGTVLWTYSIADKAFDFLGAGETLVLTYYFRVDNNYAGGSESTLIPITITVTGTNDQPVISTSSQSITYAAGISTPGGALTTTDHTTGTFAFTDVDLTDTHKVSTKLTGAVMSNGKDVPPLPEQLFEKALTAQIGTDSTGNGNGVINWQFGKDANGNDDLPVYLADFIPEGVTLTLKYTVTVTDLQGATSEQTVTVTITGTDHAAVVWVDTKPGGGSWNDAANWGTGTVPTATDDAIVITNQLIGLTPSYPVTVDKAAAARSLSMNDFGSTPPILDVHSTLAIGAGGISAAADSVINNHGTLTVAGAAEFIDKSQLNNSGLMQLSGGGDFKDFAKITNFGTLEVVGGTLNVDVDIKNADATHSGAVAVDRNATLVLNSAAIDGGTVTVAGTGVTFVPVVQSAAFVEESGDGVITIVLQPSPGALNLEGTSSLANGTLNNSGNVKVDGTDSFDSETVYNRNTITVAGTLVLDDTAIFGGVISNFGTIRSTGGNTIHDAIINNTGTIESTAGLMTIDFVSSDFPPLLMPSPGGGFTIVPYVGLTNSGTVQANGGELDVTGELVTNTNALKAINHGTLKLSNTNVTNGGGTVTVDQTSELDLASAGITGGNLSNSGKFESVSGTNVVTAAVDDTGGTIEVISGTLDLAGGLTGAGTVIIDAGATLELGGADAQTITFKGGTGTTTLTLDSTAHSFSGTIIGNATTAGTYLVNGQGSITSASNDALDFNAAGGDGTNPDTVTLTLGGAITGAANGIHVIQNGTGDIAVNTSGTVTGLGGDGIIAEDSATGSGKITVDATGKATGTGANSVGIFVKNVNSANGGAISVTATGGATGDKYGIYIDNSGNGNVTLEAGGIVTATGATGQYGIRAIERGSGSETVTTDANLNLTSAGTGINVANLAQSVDAAAGSQINVTAYGTIHSGVTKNIDSSVAGGIYAGYRGVDPLVQQQPTPAPGVHGTVTVTNYATITADAGYGIDAYNWGVGDVTVNEKGGSITAAQTGIGAYQNGGGAGNVTVNVDSNLSITGTTGFGIQAFSAGTGKVAVTMSDGDTVTSGSSGIVATDAATAIDLIAGSSITVNARGTINSGTGGTGTLAGILAGYSGQGAGNPSAATLAVNGTVTVNNYANVTAPAGYGIDAFNYGQGDVTVNDEDGTTVSGATAGIGAFQNSHGTGNVTVNLYGNASVSSVSGFGIDAASNGSGKITVTTSAGSTVSSGNIAILAKAAGSGDVYISSAGHVTSTGAAGIVVNENSGATGSTTINNSGTVLGAAASAAIVVHGNSTGTATIDNSGAIGPATISASTAAIFEDGANLTIDNTSGGVINGHIHAAHTSFHNEAGATWNTGGASSFGTAGDATASTIDNAGIINLSSNASLSGPAGLAITNEGTIDNVAGAGTITGTISASITNTGTIEVTGGSLTLIGSTVTNSEVVQGATHDGTVSTVAGTTLNLAGSSILGGIVTNNGTIDTTYLSAINAVIKNDGTIEAMSGTLTLTGSLSGQGSLKIDAGATIELQLNDSQDITFNGSNAKLIVDGSVSLTGHIHGLVNTDQIDLQAIDYNTATAVYDSITGVLKVTDAAHHEVDLNIGTSYTGTHFAGINDGTGGTLITLKALDDAPTVTPASATASFSEQAGQTGSGSSDPAAPDPSASGTLTFRDIDLTDRPTALATASITLTAADGSTDLTASLTDGQKAALTQALQLKPAANTNNGSVGWTYSIADSKLDFLADGQTLHVNFTVTIDDGQTGSATSQIKVTIHGTNDAPHIDGVSSDAISTNEDSQVKISGLSVSDPDAGSTIEKITLHVDHGSIDFDGYHGSSVTVTGTLAEINAALHDGVFYTPESNYSGIDTLHLSVNDQVPNAALSDAASVGIAVKPVADAPAFAASPYSGDAGSPIALTGLASLTDTDGSEHLSLTLSGFPAGTTFSVGTPGTGADAGKWIITSDNLASLGSTPLTMTTPASFGGNFSLHVDATVTDSATLQSGPVSDTKTFSNDIDVAVDKLTAADDAIMPGNSGQVAFNENTGTAIAGSLLLANDTDALGRSFSMTSVSAHSAHGGTVKLDGNVVTYTPAANYAGADSFTYTISEGDLTSTATVSFTVQGTQNHWNGATADWGTAADWSFGTPPVSGIDAIVDATGAYVITISGADVANSLTVAASGADVQDKTGGSLTLAGALTINAGTFSLIGGILSTSSIVVGSDGHFNAQGSVSAAINDAGIVKAVGALTLSGVLTDSGTLEIDSTLQLTGGARVQGTSGTQPGAITNLGLLEILGAATLQDVTVTNNGHNVQVDSGQTLTFDSSTITSGTLTVNGQINSTGTSFLTGVTIVNQNNIHVVSGSLTIDPAPVTNTGTIEAMDGTTLVIDQETITNSFGGKTGTIQVDSHAVLDLQGSEIDGGKILVTGELDSTGNSVISGANITNNGIIDIRSGTLTIDATSVLSGTGGFKMDGGTLVLNGALVGNVEISGAATVELGSNSQTAYSSTIVIFDPGSTGTLKLDHAGHFGGKVAGFTTGQTLDLADVAYTSKPIVVYAGNASGGVLSVYVNGHDVADIGLTGNYLGVQWVLSNDGQHGTDIRESTAGVLAATLDHSTAQQGVTMHVTGVTDGGAAVTSGLSYAWQTSTDGVSWTTVGTGSSFTPGEAQEGHVMQLVVSYTSAVGVQEVVYGLGTPNDLAVTVDQTTAQQGLPIHVTSVNDGGMAVSGGLTYLWETSTDGGQHWTQVGHSSSYTPSFAGDGGKLLQLVVNYTDSGESESVTHSFGVVALATEWTGGSHTWETGNAWSSGLAPTSTDNAVVDANGHYTVTVDQAAAAHSLVENANQATVDIVRGGVLTLGGDVVIDQGQLQIDSGGVLKDIAGSATISGSFTNNGIVEAGGGTLEIAGTVSGSGSFKIDAGATLQFDHASSENVAFTGRGTLALQNPASFSGIISDSTGSLTDKDVLDLHGLNAATTTAVTGNHSYDPRSNTTTLTVTDTSQPSGHRVETFKLAGNLSGSSWTVADDHHGGVTIVDPPATASDIVADAPDQVLTGTGSADNFVFSANFGKDTITNFVPGADSITLDHTAFSGDVNALLAATRDDGNGNTVITVDANDTITLQHVLKTQLAAHTSDFHFI